VLDKDSASEEDVDLAPVVGLLKAAQQEVRSAQERLDKLKEQTLTWEALSRGVEATMAWCRESRRTK
jgi:hypothetical protein